MSAAGSPCAAPDRFMPHASALAQRAHSLGSVHVAIKEINDGAASSVRPGPPSLISLAGVRVLLVDDDLEQLELASTILQDAHAEVVTATSASQAIQELARHAPDVIVSDINMPDCDGYHLLRMVRTRSLREGGATPAIALTGKTTTADHNRALLAGYQLHIAKPVGVPELLGAIRRIVDREPTP